MAKVVVDARGCWLWQAARNAKGYGVFNPTHDHTVLAHRWAYEQRHGAVPAGLVLDHVVCDTPQCANPDHVQPATSRANTLRSPATKAAQFAARVTCPKGHPWTQRRGRRVCNACRREAYAQARR